MLFEGRPMKINSIMIQFAIGLLFGLGLVVAGMSNPAKVLNFLDFASIPKSGWDPSLAFVLGGGVITTFLGYRFVLKRPEPVFSTTFHLPIAKQIDQAIIVGPAIFGIGWGLAGFCPGPAFTGLATGAIGPLIFVAAMLAGMFAGKWYSVFTVKTNEVDART
jgi:uncharacterized protein